MKIGKNIKNKKQVLIDRKEINPKEKDANAIIYGMSGSGKSTIVKEEIRETINSTQDEIYLFTSNGCLNEYDEFTGYKNFHLLSHDSLMDSSIRNYIYQNKFNEGTERIWVYIENGNVLSKEQISHIAPMFVMSRGYHLIMTLIISEYEKWIDECAYNVSYHIFKEMTFFELKRFPSFYLLNDEKDYIVHNNPLRERNFSRKAIVKLMDIEKETIVFKTF